MVILVHLASTVDQTLQQTMPCNINFHVRINNLIAKSRDLGTVISRSRTPKNWSRCRHLGNRDLQIEFSHSIEVGTAPYIATWLKEVFIEMDRMNMKFDHLAIISSRVEQR